VAAAALLVLALGACSSVRSIPPLQTDDRTGGKAVPDYDSLMRVGAAMRSANDLEGAVGVYRQASIRDPLKSDPLVQLGETLLELGKYNEASTAFEAALRINPTQPAALVGQAKALLQSNRPQLALAPLEREIKAHPDDVKARTALGIAQDLTNDHKAAQATYHDALMLDPQNAALTGDLALSLAIEGRTDEAIQLLRPLASGPDGTPRLRQNLALIYGLAGDHDAASRLARLDLDETSVAHNLEFYETLRTLPPDARTRAILSTPSTIRTVTPGASPNPER